MRFHPPPKVPPRGPYTPAGSRIVARAADKEREHVEQPVRGRELLRDDPDRARRLLRTMMLIRRLEERAEEQYTRARIGGYCHLAIGEEAATVGAVDALGPHDYLFAS